MRHEPIFFVMGIRLFVAVIIISLMVAGAALAKDYKMMTPISSGIAEL